MLCLTSSCQTLFRPLASYFHFLVHPFFLPLAVKSEPFISNSNKIESVIYEYVHVIIDLLKPYLRYNTVANISKSFTYKMAAKTSWHRYKTNLRYCQPMYSSMQQAHARSQCYLPFTCTFQPLPPTKLLLDLARAGKLT